ncbi:hypothetical protein ISU10_21085 [Nocardioides agariphilus]|uniref:Uncharacterized protein n=1 Tax=Nocardioides agariphilus TaxID=433664 RepID=A0A930YKH8_9ACTN|nr:hypothetical protein [Nocardioides agariphilus]MBF4770278.1 hypothetical protein [Nocardioides agariphilus]
MNDLHRALRKEWDAKIRAAGGGECAERVCIMPTRRIEPNSDWHLAHDHTKGPDDYLGPAHAECNVNEALERGHVWPTAPTKEEMLERVYNPKRMVAQADGTWKSMHTRYEVRSREGELLGIFPTPITDNFEAVRALIEKHPGAEVRSTVGVDNPCSEHPAYEADNCPTCGTAASW